MKKIFAIALALVMVLSMTAAFAACPTINWACSTSVCTDGKGAVEVIPYVKGNVCGNPGYTYTPNTCAGAINTDVVYFAVKVTVEENPNADWWKEATLTMSKKGLDDVKFGTHTFATTGFGGLDEKVKKVTDNENKLKAGEYYLVCDGEWKFVPAADYDAVTDGLFTAEVNNASIAKVCFALKSKVDASAGAWYSVGDYFIKWDNGDIQVSDKTSGFESRKLATFDINGSDLIEKVTYQIWDAAGTKTTDKVLTGFGFIDANGASVGTCDPYAWLAKAMEYLKLDFRATCYTKDAFKANFGWEDKVESCFAWSDKVQSVVDAECVVAIPKTGDASVLAWLF